VTSHRANGERPIQCMPQTLQRQDRRHTGPRILQRRGARHSLLATRPGVQLPEPAGLEAPEPDSMIDRHVTVTGHENAALQHRIEREGAPLLSHYRDQSRRW